MNDSVFLLYLLNKSHDHITGVGISMRRGVVGVGVGRYMGRGGIGMGGGRGRGGIPQSLSGAIGNVVTQSNYQLFSFPFVFNIYSVCGMNVQDRSW